MSETISLNGTWNLCHTEQLPGILDDYYTGTELQTTGQLAAEVPAPIHQVLVDHGLIDDPRFGINSLKARWVEEMFWTYRRTFDLLDDAVNASTATLSFACLEAVAGIWLNGEKLGTHENAYRPARFDVSGKLKAKDNILVVQLETGIHKYSDAPGKEYRALGIQVLNKMMFIRKPSYQTGWDWQSRLSNVGILGDVTLVCTGTATLEDVSVYAIPNENLDAAKVTIAATINGSFANTGTISATILETGARTEAEISIPVDDRVSLELDIENPDLWWPIGHGDQNRYTIEVSLTINGETETITRKTGVRLVEMDQSVHPVEGRYCILTVNKRPIFCKGGNWVPADMLYSSVTDERINSLVDTALEANFNMLRVWGGGCYAEDALAEACDSKGIMIWQDYMFACLKYPGDYPDFVENVRQEARYNVRRLAHHPSIVVWCGNNEIEEGDWHWGFDDNFRTHPHYAMFHHDLPKISFEENPSVVHWLASPWSPDYKDPRDPTCGDQHSWVVSTMEDGPSDFWKYRPLIDRFPNEGGVLGASSIATIKQFLPENEQAMFSPSWTHHDNSCSMTTLTPGGMGRTYATVEMWTGLKIDELSMEDYVFASSLLQAEGLQEYASSFRQKMPSTAAAIFWMYNDSWPTTHSWTIIDYYLRKKLSFHPVRRGFAPVAVFIGEYDDCIRITGVNDSLDAFEGDLRFGLFNLSGDYPLDESLPVSIPSNTAVELASFTKEDWLKHGIDTTGAFAVLSKDDETVSQCRYLIERFVNMHFSVPDITITQADGKATFSSDVFIWGLCLDLEGEMDIADNCFDLLPGIPYTIDWPHSQAPTIVKTGNDLIKE
ncbi:MAG: hypothetical protein HRT89_15595 [Lentisphaeria bacterium]|nr:hypothetical protein [Lentisphaeria bacterium]NQZ69481.1 hypothetical protein [Lentisphaeria bacterium]